MPIDSPVVGRPLQFPPILTGGVDCSRWGLAPLLLCDGRSGCVLRQKALLEHARAPRRVALGEQPVAVEVGVAVRRVVPRHGFSVQRQAMVLRSGRSATGRMTSLALWKNIESRLDSGLNPTVASTILTIALDTGRGAAC